MVNGMTPTHCKKNVFIALRQNENVYQPQCAAKN
jgi:hypothetical protein